MKAKDVVKAAGFGLVGIVAAPVVGVAAGAMLSGSLAYLFSGNSREPDKEYQAIAKEIDETYFQPTGGKKK